MSALDLSSFRTDLDTLKREVGQLLGQLRQGAASSALAASSEVDETARQLYRGAAAQGQRSAQALSRTIVEQPIAAILIALGVGFLGGRLLPR